MSCEVECRPVNRAEQDIARRFKYNVAIQQPYNLSSYDGEGRIYSQNSNKLFSYIICKGWEQEQLHNKSR